MSFSEVETLFHEFGHGLQHMLTEVDYGLAAGIREVEWDAVELPSQFMENWCYDRKTLLEMSQHFETAEPLPQALFEKIRSARTFRSGSATLRQLMFGFIDLELHHGFDPAGKATPFDVQRRVAERTSVLPPLPEDRFLCSFAHIFAGGYAAGYYSYKWAEVLSAMPSPPSRRRASTTRKPSPLPAAASAKRSSPSAAAAPLRKSSVTSEAETPTPPPY